MHIAVEQNPLVGVHTMLIHTCTCTVHTASALNVAQGASPHCHSLLILL